MLWDRKARRVFVLDYARNLARSGRYDDWEAIEAETRAFISLSPAETWFSDPSFRCQLNQLCELARKGHTGPRGWKGARLKPPERLV